MACLLIVDDDDDNARQMVDVLTVELPGDYDIFSIQGLGEYRRFRRLHKPDLILVELLRQQSNGFTLAATLARQCSVPVVLLTDRSVVSDRIWASARGIAHVLSRCAGQARLAVQIASLLQNGFLPPCGENLKSPPEKVALSKSLALELMTTPETALLACLAGELRQLPITRSANLIGASLRGPDHFARLNNLLPYIVDIDRRNAIRDLLQLSDSQPEKSWLCTRENSLLLLEPEAGSILRASCREDWSTICQSLKTDVGGPGKYVSRCKQLLNALTFLPGSELTAGNIPAELEVDPSALMERLESALYPAAGSEVLKALITSRCLRALICLEYEGAVTHASPLRDLANLCLVLRVVTAQQHWQPVLEECLSALYGWAGMQPAVARERLIARILSLLDDHLYASSDAKVFKPSRDDCLSADSAQKLARSMTDISLLLMREGPRHQRLCCLMVSVYKLRSWLEFSMDGKARNVEIRNRWRLVTGCLYDIVCHGVLHAGRLEQADIDDMSRFVQELLHCSQQGRAPSETALMDLAALEIAIANRCHSGTGADHQLLAAGLHRLPKPDCIVADILSDIKQSGTALSEITHELVLLTEGARRLGVGRVESLAKLLLDCYQQLNMQPELLQRKTLRLALGRAHKVLCRLLDQAAAWLPLDQTGSGLTVPAVIDDLFTQFDHSKRKTIASTRVRDAGARVDDGQAAWVQCESLNRRLRQLVSRTGSLSGYRSLMAELLSEQQALILPHLPYQSPE